MASRRHADPPPSLATAPSCGLTSRQPSQDQTHQRAQPAMGIQIRIRTRSRQVLPARVPPAAEMGVRSTGRQASGPVARRTSRLAHRRSSWMAPSRRGRPFVAGSKFPELVQYAGLSVGPNPGRRGRSAEEAALHPDPVGRAVGRCHRGRRSAVTPRMSRGWRILVHTTLRARPAWGGLGDQLPARWMVLRGWRERRIDGPGADGYRRLLRRP